MTGKQNSVLTMDDLAIYLKISKSSLYKLAQEGKLPGQKVGKHWRFHKDAVDQWLKLDALADFKKRKKNKE